MNSDIAHKDHWDSIYENSNAPSISGWKPNGYCALTIENILLNEIQKSQPKTILEIGCGNSVWLPYLAKKTNAEVFGLDYSEEGCRLAREQLKIENVKGTVFCADLFKADLQQTGQFDFVYSLGVAEHFSDLTGVLEKMLQFVKPGGILLTEVPNLGFLSLHYIMSWIWHPALLAKHVPTDKKKLLKAYRALSLKEIRAAYKGIFSLDIVAWELYPRWRRLAQKLVPFIRKVHYKTDSLLSRKKNFNGYSFTSPFIYIAGKK
jgi:SAM-dependent methyltransferase